MAEQTAQSVSLRTWFADRYGGKRGLLEHLVQSGRHRLGLLRRYEDIAWQEVARVVYVCHGNICRSPYAEAVTRIRHGLPSASFGLHATSGAPPYPLAVSIAASRNIDLAGHQASRFEDFAWQMGDLLLAMEPGQAEVLRALAEQTGKVMQISLLGLFADRPRPHLADPYGCSAAYFHTCFALIENAVATVVARCQREGLEVTRSSQ